MIFSLLNSTQSMLTDGSTIFVDNIIDTTKSVIDNIVIDYRYVVVMMSLLSIERILYSYLYIYPQHFMDSCKKGKSGKKFQTESYKWKSAMTLSIYTKVFFQFPVAIYDILIYNNIVKHIIINYYDGDKMLLNNFYNNMTDYNGSTFLHLLLIGIVLLLIGQGLNVASYNALGNAGIYYGYELGYKLPYITNKFPYTTTVSKFLKHPQYTGVLCSIWGIYVMIYSLFTAATTTTTTTTSATSSSSMLPLSFFLFPVVETFWYVASMKVLENPRGRNIMTFLGYPPMLMENEKVKKAQ